MPLFSLANAKPASALLCAWKPQPAPAIRPQRARLIVPFGERGYSLIIAVAIVSLLMMVGAMVLEQVFADTQLSGSERAAQDALYVADAGAVWGQQQLVNVVFPDGIASSASATPLISALTALTPLPNNDAMCPDLTAAQCSLWYLLTPSPLPGWVAYGANSNYRVAATCNPQPCSNANTPVSYSIRAMSTCQGGAKRLVEVVLGP